MIVFEYAFTLRICSGCNIETFLDVDCKLYD